jgi:hypothetical protein
VTTNTLPRHVAFWTLALGVAVLWPGRVLSPLDGVPLNGRAEAVLIGLVLPALWWIDRGFLGRPIAHGAIVALLVLKLSSFVALPQHGLCARFSTAAPFSGVSDMIPIEEPAGTLRSWDLRADWSADAPRCTAILDRAYRSRSEFPTWFVNLLNTIRPNAGELTLDVAGHLEVDRPGTFVVETGEDMIVDGQVGGARVSAADGAQILLQLAGGSHAIQLHVASRGERWRFVPLWNGQDAWRATRLTVSDPSWLDRAASRAVAFATTAIVLLIAAAWSVSLVSARALPAPAVIWTVLTAGVFASLAVVGRFERLASLLLAASAFVPIAKRHRNDRAAFVLLGIPWLALLVAHAWAQVGRVTLYSLDDDWHMYQTAAYRIFMNGYWVEGGTLTSGFHRLLYRWIVGALHLLFGDSSVGELYWDAACLLIAALVCFAILKRVSGFRWGLVAGAMTLATFTASPIWYLVGRGLSEISSVGFMALAALYLMRARLGRIRAALVAGLFAVLMFYTRLNHLLLAGFMLAFLLPLRIQARWRDVRRAIRRVRIALAAAYLSVVAAGVLLFAAHTWWYAGHFSLFYGTSFGLQQTGLRPATIGSVAVWSKIGEALAAQLSMQEPPAFDLRAGPLVVGAVLSVLALAQVPYARTLPAPLALVTFGTIAGSFVAYTHEYPGRMSVHVVPFAVGMTVCAAAQLVRRKTLRANV